MFKFYISKSNIKRHIKNFKDLDEIDTSKEAAWYLNQVYAYLAKTHGKRYSYTTPPGTERKNLRVRSRRLLRELANSRFVNKSGSVLIAGFDIGPGDPRGNYLGVHVGEDASDAPFKLTPSNVKNVYNHRGRNKIAIPLRAATNPDGSIKPITARVRSRLRLMPFRVAEKLPQFDWAGEHKKKFNPNALILYKIVGRRHIPMYVLANKAFVPRRLLIVPAMDRYKDKFYERLESQIEKQLNKLGRNV